jgi:hypothetical protein
LREWSGIIFEATSDVVHSTQITFIFEACDELSYHNLHFPYN